MHSTKIRPPSHLSTSIPNTNCIPNPANTWRHRTFPGCLEHMNKTNRRINIPPAETSLRGSSQQSMTTNVRTAAKPRIPIKTLPHLKRQLFDLDIYVIKYYVATSTCWMTQSWRFYWQAAQSWHVANFQKLLSVRCNRTDSSTQFPSKQSKSLARHTKIF